MCKIQVLTWITVLLAAFVSCAPVIPKDTPTLKFKGVYVYPPITTENQGCSQTVFIYFKFHPDGTCEGFDGAYISAGLIKHHLDGPFVSGTYAMEDTLLTGVLQSDGVRVDLAGSIRGDQISARMETATGDIRGPYILKYREYAPFKQIRAAMDGTRITAKVKLDGLDANFILDTGAPNNLISIFSPTAKERGYTVYTGKYSNYIISELGIGLNNVALRTIPVLDVPFKGKHQGLIEWFMIKKYKWCFNWDKNEIFTITSIPEEVLTWKSWNLEQRAPYPVITFEEEGKIGRVLVDTGWESGIVLSKILWSAWYQEKVRPVSIKGSFSSATDGVQITKECWADEIILGPIQLKNVQVSESRFVAGLDNYVDGVISIEILSRFDLYLDGPGSKIYYRERETAGLQPCFNKLGASFCPRDLNSPRLFAHVLFRSAAYNAGLREGDEILAVDGVPIPDWREDTGNSQDSQGPRPAGTKYKFTIMRDGRKMDFNVVLPQISEMPTSEIKTEEAVRTE